MVLLCALLCLAGCVSSACAASLDISRIGSITFRITSGYEHVPGGNMLLMKVADLQYVAADGHYEYRFVWLPEIADIPLDPRDAGSYEYARQVYDLAQDRGLPVRERQIDANGVTSFRELSTGMYLFWQTVPAEGFQTIAPFIVTLPMKEDGVYVYDIDASPKPSVIPESTTAPVPTTEPPVTTTEPSTEPSTEPPAETTVPSTTPSTEPPTGKPPTSEPDETTTDYTQTEPPETTVPDVELPHTGQLKWPVSALGVAGLLLVSFGWLIRSSERRGDYDDE